MAAIAILPACVLLTVFIDFAEARFQNTGFYFSESFLFSSFWWLFRPLMYVQFSINVTRKIDLALCILLPMALHLFAYPAAVWAISKAFYNYTFPYWQTFGFGFTEYFFILLIGYSVPFALYRFFINNPQPHTIQPLATEEKPARAVSFIVNDGSRHLAIGVNDILFFSANPPYVNIHHKSKKHLCHETLRSVLTKVDQDVFVRIHKSTIVNLACVQSYRSRLNGDYDLRLNEGTILRLSRNYAADFKLKFESSHRDTP